MNERFHAVQGAFMMEGLHDAGYDAVIEAWGMGCLEMIERITYFTHHIECTLFHYQDQDFPGIFEYEVTAQFGKWWGEQVLAGTLGGPSDKECKDKLSLLISEFFEQGKANAPSN